jgi:hypothetical protein
MYLFNFWFGIIGIRFSGTLGLNPGRRTPFSNLMSPLTCIQVTQNPFISQLHFQTSKLTIELRLKECFGSGLDPDSIRSVDPDSESGSGSRRTKMTHKNIIFFLEISCFEVLDVLFEG